VRHDGEIAVRRRLAGSRDEVVVGALQPGEHLAPVRVDHPRAVVVQRHVVLVPIGVDEERPWKEEVVHAHAVAIRQHADPVVVAVLVGRERERPVAVGVGVRDLDDAEVAGNDVVVVEVDVRRQELHPCPGERGERTTVDLPVAEPRASERGGREAGRLGPSQRRRESEAHERRRDDEEFPGSAGGRRHGDGQPTRAQIAKTLTTAGLPKPSSGISLAPGSNWWVCGPAKAPPIVLLVVWRPGLTIVVRRVPPTLTAQPFGRLWSSPTG
jgi:hypothetical protein